MSHEKHKFNRKPEAFERRSYLESTIADAPISTRGEQAQAHQDTLENDATSNGVDSFLPKQMAGFAESSANSAVDFLTDKQELDQFAHDECKKENFKAIAGANWTKMTFNSVLAGSKFNNNPVYDHFITKPNIASYASFIELSGILQPGQVKDYI